MASTEQGKETPAWLGADYTFDGSTLTLVYGASRGVCPDVHNGSRN
ncbi:MAG: hypothetical protein HOQ05_05805 [Corynebacteriales bacterium]|nr:hypothetical protein [Mycobacteriales bacterium]